MSRTPLMFFFAIWAVVSANSLVADTIMGSLDEQNRIVVTNSGESIQLLGLEFISEGGFLVPIPGSIAAPFANLLSNTTTKITLGSLPVNPPVHLDQDGSLILAAKYTGPDGFTGDDLIGKWGGLLDGQQGLISPAFIPVPVFINEGAFQLGSDTFPEGTDEVQNASGGSISGSGSVPFPLANRGTIDATGSEQLFGNIDNRPEGQIAASNSNISANLLANSGNLASSNQVVIVGDIVNEPDSSIHVASGSLQVDGNLTQNGTLHIQPAAKTLVNGTFSGVGGSEGGGDLEIHGALSPGNSVAQPSFQGSLLLGDGSVTLIEIENESNFDTITVDGQVTLGGTLRVTFLDEDYAPDAGSTFEIFSASNGLSGEFDGASFPSLNEGLRWAVAYDQNAATLRVIPEPSAFVILIMGLGGLFTLRRSA